MNHRQPGLPDGVVLQPVVVHQTDPIAVEVWPSAVGVVLKILLGVLGLLHAAACITFLYVVVSVYSAMNDFSERMSQFGVGG